MNEENLDQGSQEAKPPAKRGRLQSTIQFAYGDLDTAIEVAEAMHRSGYRECAPDQLAAAMHQSLSSGNFRHKISTARIFGLVKTAPGQIAITDLGYRVLDPGQASKAKIDAFLSVELYRRLYDDFRGKPLPPRPAALERAFENYGVSSKQTDKARQAFDRAAKQAGFFIHGNDKLVMPGGMDLAPPSKTDLKADEPKSRGLRQGGGGDDGGSLNLDPLIMALLQKLPTEPKHKWPLVERAKWLRALAMNFSFVYEPGEQDSGEIQVSIKANSLTENPASRD